MGRTHALLGINSLWILTLLPVQMDTINFAVLTGCAVFGALVPDLDAVESTLKHAMVAKVKPFYLPAVALNRDLGHRGLLHSLRGWGWFALLCLPLLFWNWQVWVALLLGYASHLLADSCTRSGILLCYPNPKRYHCLPHGCRLVTGSQAEEAVFALSGMAALCLLLLQLSQMSGV